MSSSSFKDIDLFFFEKGLSYLKKSFDKNVITSTNHRDFRAGFGVSPVVCCLVWRHICDDESSLLPEHLLWALLFLKSYKTETVLASIVETYKKIYRKQVFKIIESISSLSEFIVSKT